MPEGLYPGDYLKDVGAALAARDGHKWHNAPEAEWLPPVRRFAIDAMTELVRPDLDFLGVHQEVLASARALVDADPKSVGKGKSVSALADLGGRRVPQK